MYVTFSFSLDVLCREANSAGGSMSKDKLPKANWTQHAIAHDNFSCQDKFLSSNILFSLPTQRHCARDEMNARCATLSLSGLFSRKIAHFFYFNVSKKITSAHDA